MPAKLISLKTKSALDSMEAMWGQVDAARGSIDLSVNPRPANSFTLADYALKFGVNYSTAQGQLTRLVKAGTLNKLRCYVTAANGRLMISNVYSPISKGGVNAKTK